MPTPSKLTPTKRASSLFGDDFVSESAGKRRRTSAAGPRSILKSPSRTVTDEDIEAAFASGQSPMAKAPTPRRALVDINSDNDNRQNRNRKSLVSRRVSFASTAHLRVFNKDDTFLRNDQTVQKPEFEDPDINFVLEAQDSDGSNFQIPNLSSVRRTSEVYGFRFDFQESKDDANTSISSDVSSNRSMDVPVKGSPLSQSNQRRRSQLFSVQEEESNAPTSIVPSPSFDVGPVEDVSVTLDLLPPPPLPASPASTSSPEPRSILRRSSRISIASSGNASPKSPRSPYGQSPSAPNPSPGPQRDSFGAPGDSDSEADFTDDADFSIVSGIGGIVGENSYKSRRSSAASRRSSAPRVSDILSPGNGSTIQQSYDHDATERSVGRISSVNSPDPKAGKGNVAILDSANSPFLVHDVRKAKGSTSSRFRASDILPEVDKENLPYSEIDSPRHSLDASLLNRAELGSPTSDSSVIDSEDEFPLTTAVGGLLNELRSESRTAESPNPSKNLEGKGEEARPSTDRKNIFSYGSGSMTPKLLSFADVEDDHRSFLPQSPQTLDFMDEQQLTASSISSFNDDTFHGRTATRLIDVATATPACEFSVIEETDHSIPRNPVAVEAAPVHAEAPETPAKQLSASPTLPSTASKSPSSRQKPTTPSLRSFRPSKPSFDVNSSPAATVVRKSPRATTKPTESGRKLVASQPASPPRHQQCLLPSPAKKSPGLQDRRPLLGTGVSPLRRRASITAANLALRSRSSGSTSAADNIEEVILSTPSSDDALVSAPQGSEDALVSATPDRIIEDPEVVFSEKTLGRIDVDLLTDEQPAPDSPNDSFSSDVVFSPPSSLTLDMFMDMINLSFSSTTQSALQPVPALTQHDPMKFDEEFFNGVYVGSKEVIVLHESREFEQNIATLEAGLAHFNNRALESMPLVILDYLNGSRQEQSQFSDKVKKAKSLQHLQWESNRQTYLRDVAQSQISYLTPHLLTLRENKRHIAEALKILHQLPLYERRNQSLEREFVRLKERLVGVVPAHEAEIQAVQTAQMDSLVRHEQCRERRKLLAERLAAAKKESEQLLAEETSINRQTTEAKEKMVMKKVLSLREFTSLQEDYQILVAATSWSPIRISPSKVSLQYDDTVTITFNRHVADPTYFVHIELATKKESVKAVWNARQALDMQKLEGTLRNVVRKWGSTVQNHDLIKVLSDVSDTWTRLKLFLRDVTSIRDFANVKLNFEKGDNIDAPRLAASVLFFDLATRTRFRVIFYADGDGAVTYPFGTLCWSFEYCYGNVR
ncbi:hypothetical protein M427DRAFT_408094 [Gonapodya prolifera JEL478]|uniref:Spc7 kinetochore protein domain-containing protein n=1 Tax=Gonapodya prolifera (strain JEL478) TaxID=1344416 RepID=A0A139A6U2_GONPJ|nr:hypothetical protein M427DRAFT_408094 [Gonapodya prolifera JEL478]|eukprot:KXS12165.1 hypothetical protein M427DRAFT_408094 [Gonapodya prolifera JEL478]